MFRRKTLWLLTLGVGTCLGGVLADGAALPERKIFQFGEFQIEASVGDEAYVEALALQLPECKLPVTPEAPPAPISLEDLNRRRDHFLAQICAQIGLDRSTADMIDAYDGTQKLVRKIASAKLTRIPRHYALWHRAELLARLQAGEKVAGFTLAPEGGLDFGFNFQFDKLPDDGRAVAAEIAARWDQIVLPVKIEADAGKPAPEEVRASLDGVIGKALGSFEAVVRTLEQKSVFFTLHETAEAGIVSHYLASKDRRWFCDGVANYVAWSVLREEIGTAGANGFYDVSEELVKFAPEASRVDLVAWPAAENLKKENYSEDLNAANYAFATKVISDVCAKHGDYLLPKLFAEVGRTPREKTTMETVYKAYKRLFHEDLRSYLPRAAKH